MAKTQKLLVDDIERNAKTQARAATTDSAVDEYSNLIQSGGTLPPVHVFYDGESYRVADGWHRLLAHLDAGNDFIDAVVVKGGLRDAQLYAAGANQGHGVRRTNADKKLAVKKLLKDKEWGKWSSRRIAEHCGVSHTLVDELRNSGGSSATRKKDAEDAGKEGHLGRNGETTPVLPDQTETEDSELDIDDLAEEYKSLNNAILSVKRTVKKMAEDEKYGGYLAVKITRITTGLDEVRGAIRQAEPMEWCEKCDGKGCKSCLRSGFITRSAVGSRGK